MLNDTRYCNFRDKKTVLSCKQRSMILELRINTPILISVLINLLAVTRRTPLISRARVSSVSKSCTVGFILSPSSPSLSSSPSSSSTSSLSSLLSLSVVRQFINSKLRKHGTFIYNSTVSWFALTGLSWDLNSLLGCQLREFYYKRRERLIVTMHLIYIISYKINWDIYNNRT